MTVPRTSDPHRPSGYGVEVAPGALTIYNRCTDPKSHWTLSAENLSGGTREMPLKGSGIFIFGGMTVPANADPQGGPAPSSPGGTIDLKLLTTGEIHTNGSIPAGVGNLITGGIFVGSGVKAQQVVNNGAGFQVQPTVDDEMLQPELPQCCHRRF